MGILNETREIANERCIVFVGHGGIGSNALSMYKGIHSVVKNSRMVDTKFFDTPPRFSVRRILCRLFPKFYGRVSSGFLGFAISKVVRDMKPDVVIVFKGNYVSSSTLKSIQALKVHYHPDDSSNEVNRTAIFNAAEVFYDVHFTSKRHNIQEISDRTKRDVHFIWYAYDDDWHFRKKPLNFRSPKFLFGFIGHMRPDRIDLVVSLAKQYGKNFAVTGLNWGRLRDLRFRATLFPPAYGSQFSEFIAKVPIQLGLLNSDNRDQHTARSFEVPAAGGLLIAEDTSEHREIFGMGENAIFFDGLVDLRQKLAVVLSNPKYASQIAENGYRHITTNQNTWRDRSLEMLEILTLYI